MTKLDLESFRESIGLSYDQRLQRELEIQSKGYPINRDNLTGFATIDKPWLKYYKTGAEAIANNIPVNKTVWDVIEEKLYEYYDIPAIQYFGREFSKQEFIDLCYVWARTFRAMGVEKGEVVPVYGPFVPDICAMVFALNMIGATPYFLKLAISPKALEEETRDSKIAVVFDGMWANVANEFAKDKFKTVIVASAAHDMPSPKKEIVSFMNKMQAIKNKSRIPEEKKYIWADKAREIANYYTGDVKVPFEANRSAFITSSSGTTVGGIVKGTVATNESTISQLLMGNTSGIQYYPGDKCLNHFPPTASTSLNALFLLALYHGEIVLLDPRVSEKDFYNQITKLKPNIALTTGSAWEAFFNRVEKEILAGKKFDFSFAKGWTVGGEGTVCRKFKNWNAIMQYCGAKGIYSGYGSSELFSAVSVEELNARYDFSKPVMSVGIPYAGITVGIFDENGNELKYNQRGEIRIKSESSMKEYYKKPETTAKTKVDGAIRTGDLGEIDENGFLYIWGRTSDKVKNKEGREIYLFDIANKIKEHEFIDDAIVLAMPTEETPHNLVAHIVWADGVQESQVSDYLAILNKSLKEYLPKDVVVSGYYEHAIMLPYSPTTLKKDRNKMSEQLTGYIQEKEGEMYQVEFEMNEKGNYSKKCAIIKKGIIKTLKRK